MADSDLLVTISGAALSLLFYENVRSLGDQMGFLLGETLEFVVKTYTDSDNQVETVKIHNNIETVVTCPLPDLLHDSTGRINKEKLKDFLRDKSKQVIGWFRFRRNTNLLPTMRDKILHKEFASHFSGSNGSKEEFFLMCLLSSSMSTMRGTHKFRHVFLRRKRGRFEPITLRINNLGNDSFRHDGSDYKPTPAKKLSDTPDVFTSLIESLNLDLTRTAGFESAITIQRAAEQYLNRLIPEVCESDLEVAELEKQVKELRSNVSMCKFSKKVKVNGSSDMADQNYEIEKSNNEDGRKSEKACSPRIESPDNISDDSRILKDHTSSTSQTIAAHKTRNTAAYIAKSVSQNKTKRTVTVTDTHSNLNQEPVVNTVSEVKMDIAESVVNRSRRSTGVVPGNAKESICKTEINESGVGRGRGKLMHEFNSGMKKARRTSGPIATRSSSERNSFSQLTDQDSSEANCVQHASPVQVSYSQATRKGADNTRSTPDTADNQ